MRKHEATEFIDLLHCVKNGKEKLSMSLDELSSQARKMGFEFTSSDLSEALCALKAHKKGVLNDADLSHHVGIKNTRQKDICLSLA